MHSVWKNTSSSHPTPCDISFPFYFLVHLVKTGWDFHPKSGSDTKADNSHALSCYMIIAMHVRKCEKVYYSQNETLWRGYQGGSKLSGGSRGRRRAGLHCSSEVGLVWFLHIQRLALHGSHFLPASKACVCALLSAWPRCREEGERGEVWLKSCHQANIKTGTGCVMTTLSWDHVRKWIWRGGSNDEYLLKHRKSPILTMTSDSLYFMLPRPTGATSTFHFCIIFY